MLDYMNNYKYITIGILIIALLLILSMNVESFQNNPKNDPLIHLRPYYQCKQTGITEGEESEKKCLDKLETSKLINQLF